MEVRSIHFWWRCTYSLGTHVLDLLTWYFGSVVNVNGKVKSVYSPGIEDFAHLILEHQNGVILQFLIAPGV